MEIEAKQSVMILSEKLHVRKRRHTTDLVQKGRRQNHAANL